jgi:hypothetical protein
MQTLLLGIRKKEGMYQCTAQICLFYLLAVGHPLGVLMIYLS